MRKTSLFVLNMLLAGNSAVKLGENSESVDMTNPDYISSMTLSAWKLYTPDERLELYKASELKVNRFQSSITSIENDNLTNKETLK